MKSLILLLEEGKKKMAGSDCTTVQSFRLASGPIDGEPCGAIELQTPSEGHRGHSCATGGYNINGVGQRMVFHERLPLLLTL